MNRYKTSSDLKDLAKTKLDGYYKYCIVIVLSLTCFTYLSSILISSLVPGTDLTSSILFEALTLVSSVILGIFDTGVAFFYLNLYCGTPQTASSIFYPFNNQSEKSLMVSFLHTTLSFVCKTPARYFLLFLLQTGDLTYLTYWLIALVVGYAVYIPTSLFFSQTYYLLVDFPDYTAKQALLTGFKLAKQHFGKIFRLKLSFIPIYLLGIFSLGIGLLWVIPYAQMTYTCFYVDIMNPQKISE